MKFQWRLKTLKTILNQWAFKVLLGMLPLYILINCESQERNKIPITKVNQKQLDSIKYIIHEKSDPLSAYEYIIKLSNSWDKIDDLRLKAQASDIIASYYLIMKDFAKAEEYYDKTIQIYKKLNLQSKLIVQSKLLSMLYRNKGDYNKIETTLKNAIKLAEDSGIKSYDILYPIHELVVHYGYDVENYTESIKYGKLFIEKLNEFNKKVPKTDHRFLELKKDKNIIHLVMGKSYVKLKEFNEAYKNLSVAKQYYTKTRDAEKLLRVHKNFMEYYLAINDLDNANIHKDLFYHYNKLFFNSIIVREQTLSVLKASLTEKQKQEILLSEKEKSRTKFIVIIFTIILLGFFSLSFYERLNYKKKELDLKLKKESEFNSFKNELFINLAQEIRTPLNIILGYLELYDSKKHNEKELSKYRSNIKNNCIDVLNKMSEMIKMIKTKEINGDEILEIDNILFEKFLQNTFFSFESLAKLKNLRLDYNVKLPNNYVFTNNKNKLDTLLKSLINHSLKIAHNNSKVLLNSYLSNNFLVIKIIIQEQLPKNKVYPENKVILENFTKNNESKLGIGLTMAHMMAHMLNSNITTIEENKKKVYILQLPIKKNSSNAIEKVISLSYTSKESIHTSEVVFHLTKSTILIVDDNLYMHKYYNEILSKKYDCSFASNVQEAMEMIKSKQYNLIISDIELPLINGLDLKKWVNIYIKYSNLPFMIVTGSNSNEERVQAFKLGVDDYLVKPFNAIELEARIARLMQTNDSKEQISGTTKASESFDEKILKKLHNIIAKNKGNELFTVKELAEELGLNQRKLSKMVKELTGVTPNKYILEARLLEAYKKIKGNEEANIKSVMYSVGISSPSYFSIKFKERFGVKPSEL